MLEGIAAYIKYPSAAGIIGIVWISTAVLIIIDNNLPILAMIVYNMVASMIIAIIGFRTEKGSI